MEIQSYIADFLHAIGISPKYKGYAYILHILCLSANDISRTQNMSAQLYQSVCEHYQVTPMTVERNLRFAIKRTWESDPYLKMRRLFASYGIYFVPTNREFICVLADCICNGRLCAPVCVSSW